MGANNALKRWWDGADDQVRADALEAVRTGHLSERLETSLRGAGLIHGVRRPDRRLPDDVEIFLKARH